MCIFLLSVNLLTAQTLNQRSGIYLTSGLVPNYKTKNIFAINFSCLLLTVNQLIIIIFLFFIFLRALVLLIQLIFAFFVIINMKLLIIISTCIHIQLTVPLLWLFFKVCWRQIVKASYSLCFFFALLSSVFFRPFLFFVHIWNVFGWL